MNGRVHGYEGYTAAMAAFPIRVLSLLGIRNLIITNACGAIGDELFPGDLMLIQDHINLTGDSPLYGPKPAKILPKMSLQRARLENTLNLRVDR